ncbi:Selenide, water dikinase [Desulfonema magnum]|uniref:Selenide, water dikinase n=1 Tax=Desulfonema magnum TaxID=45655 RepID=A0A975BGR5_9BACT|nr:Selenide, water dikinase [Desulfonema magnum]
MPPGDLDRALCGLDFPTDPNVIVGLERADDAGVYKITDDLAIIQTVDFFTPVVDDPYWFGQIAAANALSDIYAMGGIPKTAMNLVGFPLKQMDMSVLRRILEGGSDKMKEAGVVLVGGHSVEDNELKYGLSVTGFVHPDQVLTKQNLQPGDQLILTKPLGTGIINTGIKAGLASEEIIQTVTNLMATLNKDAAEVMSNFPVHACTDVTGFGLLGHLAEMVEGTGLGIRLMADNIPIIHETFEYAGMGLIPAGAYKNKEFRESMTEISSSVNPSVPYILFDPQTSGGLLICVSRENADDLLRELKKKGMDSSAIIGEVVSEFSCQLSVVSC